MWKVVALALALVLTLPVAADENVDNADDVVPRLLQLLVPAQRDATLRLIRERWHDELAIMVLEVALLSGDATFNRRLFDLLQKTTGQRFGYDPEAWFQWIWHNEPRLHPLYPDFKAHLYGLIDPRFRVYFSGDRTMLIRLDEVRWGGVKQDGIPPLRSPPMIDAAAAAYLQASDIVFGLEIGGDVRAYPKRHPGLARDVYRHGGRRAGHRRPIVRSVAR